MHINIAIAKNTNILFNGNEFITIFLLSISQLMDSKLKMFSDYHLGLFGLKYVGNHCLNHLHFQVKLQVLEKVFFDYFSGQSLSLL